jgi:hypothetical protein
VQSSGWDGRVLASRTEQPDQESQEHEAEQTASSKQAQSVEQQLGWQGASQPHRPARPGELRA